MIIVACLLALTTSVLAYRRFRPHDRTGADLDPLAQHPSVRREMAKKAKLRAAASARGAAQDSRGGLPAGQHAAKQWILLDLGLRPAPGSYSLAPDEWKLVVVVPSGRSATLTMADVAALGIRSYVDHQWHCVTGWSATGLGFEGVPLELLLAHPKVRAAADGYTVPVAREDALAGGAFLATALDGAPLPFEHGGPRLVLPNLYGWKSAKWLVELSLVDDFSAGFWERCGCHPRGRHALNERFREGWSAVVWGWLAAAPGVYRVLGGYGMWVWVMQAGGVALGTIVSRFTVLHTPVVQRPGAASRSPSAPA
jgi:DMSO/TMAO reductase YedYZ molybdopterin-dependent catalytic subunit